MKRILFILTALFGACGTIAAEDYPSYFTMGENDTLRVRVDCLGGSLTVPVKAHFDHRYDKWNLSVTYPEGLAPVAAAEGPDMTVHYLNSQGQDAVYQAWLSSGGGWSSITATTGLAQGYWDMAGNGSYVCYGTVKWEAGDHDDMFELTFSVDSGFMNGEIVIDGQTSAGSDLREWSNGRTCRFYKTVTVFISPVLGDVNDDGKVDISDVTALITMLMNGRQASLDADGFFAADVNGDGKVDISDVTALITMLMNGI